MIKQRLNKKWTYLVLALTLVSSSYLYARAIKVNTSQVKKIVVANKLMAVGRTKAFESTQITSSVTDYVDEIHFKDGDKVKKGALLVSLLSKQEKAQLNKAKAELSEAISHYERSLKLSKRGFQAQSEHDSLKAKVEVKRAELAEREAQLEDRFIYAPFDGILGFKNISPGTLVEPGDVIVDINQISPLYIDFNVPEKYFTTIKKGAQFRFTTAAYPKQTFNADIESIHPQLDLNTGSIVVRGKISNASLKLRPGMICHITLSYDKRHAYIIPEKAINSADDKHWVFIIKHHHAIRTPIKILYRFNEQAEVQGDLKQGDSVVIDGGFKLKHKALVKAKHVAQ